VSFQITILKVLAGRVDGRATRAELTRQVSILISSGNDWSDQTKRLAVLAPGLNIFGSGFVSLDHAGWQITEAGKTFLLSLETATPAVSESDRAITDEMAAAPIAEDVVPMVIAPPTQLEHLSEGVAVSRPSKLMSLIGLVRRPRQSRQAAD
jgi:hypothetical protein